VVGPKLLAEMQQERAEALMAAQRYSDAVDDWRDHLAAVEAAGGYSDAKAMTRARLQLGISLRFTGQYAEAAHEIAQVLAKEPDNQMARFCSQLIR
jgi:hypothetical protein